VLEAAIKVFARKGLHDATVDEIAERAGYSRGAVYSNFRDKDDLLQRVFEQRIQARLEELAELVSESAPDAQERAVADLVGALATNERDYLLLLSEFWGHAARRPRIRRWFAGVRRRQRAIIREMVDERVAQADLELRLPADHLAAGLLALELGILLEGLIDEDLDLEAIHESMFHLVYRQSVQPRR
jgi:AcrR family transcriptional regulator